ncbi:acyl-CoA dehydrogenase family protein [Actinomadura fibrosa]|uniref:Acyl-CoA dehydrogenase family protein n=1 Tax=Actinomadura fibrosa TaxID=111802 RepID=A0ABW2Y1I2_9ACTN|nr:acyl-CoA dehydrogenase family protein [Actinomadura fibrosa]
MDLTPSADQRDLRAGVRDFLAGRWTPDRLRAASASPSGSAAGSAGLDPDDWKALGELGVFALGLPEERGGAGLGLVDAAIVFEELGRALVPGPLTATFLAAGLVPGADDGTSAVTALDLGDPTLVAEHLGSSAQVVLVDDGLWLLPADALAAVPLDAPLDPLTPVWRVTDPPEGGRLIGTGADAERWRTRAAVLTSALQVGVAQGALDLAVRYAKERVQFGRAVGSFQAVKHLLAESLARVDLARAATWTAALAVDGPADRPADGGAAEAVSSAKVLADDAAAANGRCCVQVHGGMGFTWEVAAHLYLKRAWLLETCWGGADEHARRLAATL